MVFDGNNHLDDGDVRVMTLMFVCLYLYVHVYNSKLYHRQSKKWTGARAKALIDTLRLPFTANG